MRVFVSLFAAGLLMLLCTAGVCQDAPPPPAPDPPADTTAAPEPPPAPAPPPGPATTGSETSEPGLTPWLLNRDKPYVIVGPSDSQGKARMIKGKILIIARPMHTAKVTSVDVRIDEKPIGPASADRMGLYGLEFDTSKLEDGEHTIKAAGPDATGKQVWTASTRIEVRNTQPQPPKTAPVVKVTPVKEPRKVTVTPKTPKAANTKQTSGTAQGKTYTSARHGFWLRLPAGWMAVDKTYAMKPAKQGNGWIEFTPGKPSGLTVNVRRTRLAPGTTADTFAKFNPYVSSWDRKTLLGAQAFSTTADAENKVIHRLIIIKNNVAWMLNCVDANGRASDAGQKVFDSIVASFGVPTKGAPKTAAKEAAKPTPKAAAKP